MQPEKRQLVIYPDYRTIWASFQQHNRSLDQVLFKPSGHRREYVFGPFDSQRRIFACHWCRGAN